MEQSLYMIGHSAEAIACIHLTVVWFVKACPGQSLNYLSFFPSHSITHRPPVCVAQHHAFCVAAVPPPITPPSPGWSSPSFCCWGPWCPSSWSFLEWRHSSVKYDHCSSQCYYVTVFRVYCILKITLDFLCSLCMLVFLTYAMFMIFH